LWKPIWRISKCHSFLTPWRYLASMSFCVNGVAASSLIARLVMTAISFHRLMSACCCVQDNVWYPCLCRHLCLFSARWTMIFLFKADEYVVVQACSWCKPLFHWLC
jgi:hypothetical protein